MKTGQHKIISIALIVMILMGIFPPWKGSLKTDKFQYEKPIGYGFIFHPPSADAPSKSIDFSRLFLQWGVVILVAGLFIFLSRKGVRD